MAAFAKLRTGGMLAAAVLAATGAFSGCEETGKAGAGVTPVRISGKMFYLEVAADDAIRTPGLGGRTHIDDDGGMVFVFARPRLLEFVMRDCPIPIDIIYTDGAGRVQTMHTMTPEGPRGDGEGRQGDLSNGLYEARLKKWPSNYPSQFAIELKAGTIEKLKVKEGDKIDFDVEGLKKIAR